MKENQPPVTSKFEWALISLLILWGALTLFSSCNPNRPPTTIDGFEAIIIQEGNHHSNPRKFGKVDKEYFVQNWRFEDADYIHHPDKTPLFQGDQKDWNKLHGDSWTPYLIEFDFKDFDFTHPNHVNTCMIGWRWNPDQEYIELNSYNHVDEARQFSAPLMIVELHQNFKTWIRPIELTPNGDSQIRLWIEKMANPDKGFEYGFKEYIIEFQGQQLPGRSREINPWFGGNLAVPIGDQILIYNKTTFTWN